MSQFINPVLEKQEKRIFSNFVDTIFNCESKKSLQAFLEDVATDRELKEMSARWEAAKLLDQGVSYRKISKLTGLSTATITRVASWLKKGKGGYQTALRIL